MYSIYEPNRVFNHCGRFAKCCLFNSCNNLFPIYRMPALRRISIDRKEIFNRRKNGIYDRNILRWFGPATNKRFVETARSAQKEHRSSSQIVDHCALLPRENFLNPFFFYPIRARRVRAGLMFVTRAVIFHRVRGKYIQWGIQSNAVVGKGIVLSGIL